MSANVSESTAYCNAPPPCPHLANPSPCPKCEKPRFWVNRDDGENRALVCHSCASFTLEPVASPEELAQLKVKENIRRIVSRSGENQLGREVAKTARKLVTLLDEFNDIDPDNSAMRALTEHTDYNYKRRDEFTVACDKVLYRLWDAKSFACGFVTVIEVLANELEGMLIEDPDEGDEDEDEAEAVGAASDADRLDIPHPVILEGGAA